MIQNGVHHEADSARDGTTLACRKCLEVGSPHTDGRKHATHPEGSGQSRLNIAEDMVERRWIA